jgi:hypothetical protein
MVLICGYKKQVGKDTFCKFLQECLPEKKIIRFAFADALKDEIYDMVLKPFGLSRDLLDDSEVKSTFRPLMQWWGTEFRRSENPKLNGNPDIWIEKTLVKIQDALSQDPNCVPVICDGRFPNEYIKLKNQFESISILIQRELDSPDPHISEKIMDDYLHLFDVKIANSNNLEEYKLTVQKFAQQYF